MRFEVFKRELGVIKTPKFHVVGGPLSDEDRGYVESSTLGVPPSYREFVVRFGNAQLYRRGSNYLIQVYGVPQEVENSKGEALYGIGRWRGAPAYFKEHLLEPGAESPVFELRGGRSIVKIASGFEEWLDLKMKAARKSFRKAEWESIIAGPEPFTEEERSIVEARKRFSMRVVGVTDEDDVVFEITNRSERCLPYLSIDLRLRDGGGHVGGVWLPVSHVGPGETASVQHECYKEWYDPRTLEAYLEAEPEPALRDIYWEFKDVGESD